MFNNLFSKNHKNMKQLATLSALTGIAASAISKEQLAAANQELADNDFNLELSASGTLASLQAKINSLSTEVETLKATNTSLSATITSQDTEIASLKDEANKAAAEETEIDTETDKGLSAPQSFSSPLSERIIKKHGLEY
jgi:outer membrane murein-binding lipoprotein Lpp